MKAKLLIPILALSMMAAITHAQYTHYWVWNSTVSGIGTYPPPGGNGPKYLRGYSPVTAYTGAILVRWNGYMSPYQAGNGYWEIKLWDQQNPYNPYYDLT